MSNYNNELHLESFFVSAPCSTTLAQLFLLDEDFNDAAEYLDSLAVKASTQIFEDTADLAAPEDGDHSHLPRLEAMVEKAINFRTPEGMNFMLASNNFRRDVQYKVLDCPDDIDSYHIVISYIS